MQLPQIHVFIFIPLTENYNVAILKTKKISLDIIVFVNKHEHILTLGVPFLLVIVSIGESKHARQQVRQKPCCSKYVL